MEYKKIELDEYNIHFIKNENFHSINCNIMFTQNVTKELITYQNVLINVLTHSTKKYDTNIELVRKCQELCLIRPTASTTRYGNLYSTSFGISILDPKYYHESSLFDGLLLLKEILLNPLVSHQSFKQEIVDFIKNEEKAYVIREREDPRSYANIRLLELMGEDNYALTGYSDLEILEEVTIKSLYRFYQKMIKESKIDIFIAGDIDNYKELKTFIKNNFIFNNHAIKLNEACTYHLDVDNEHLFKENINYRQSKIALGLKFTNLSSYENKYIVSALNTLIGGNNDALLMKRVREEKGLCYYIGSYASRLDNILIINSGIKKKDYEEIIKTIREIFHDLEKGLFSNDLLKKMKLELLEKLSSINENNINLIYYFYGQEVLHSDDILTKKEKIAHITKKDIQNIIKKVELDTIFWLEGDL